MNRFGRTNRRLLLVAVLALLATACLGQGEESAGEGGGSVEILGAFSGEEAELFNEALAVFEEESGIEVTYEGVQGFETLIVTRIQGGDPPDIALFPQPGLLLDIAEESDAPPLEEFLDIEAVEESLIPGFLDAARNAEGQALGLPMRMAVKSVLWYPVPEFEEAGYTLPETYADLEALEEQIIADGGTPWCMGMEAGESTGWVGTDWVEEFMLRLHGPDAYDAWVNHELLFDSPEVTAAWEAYGNIWQAENMVAGGTQAILSTPFGDASLPMFNEEPGCWLYRQGNFITGFFPQEVQEDLDGNVGATYFPSGMEGGFDGDPVLAGGDLALLINDTEAARQVMEFLATSEFGGPWAEAGGWLSPHRDFDASLYPNDLTRQLYQIGAEADVLRFDASDLMPGAVGAGSFWTGIVDWISGANDLQTILTNIDESWPASEEQPAGTEEQATETEALPTETQS